MKEAGSLIFQSAIADPSAATRVSGKKEEV
jgi:hypothetical protein